MSLKLVSSFLITDYLLSNNHVNSIIVHKFDFSDEEIMAYYISFLKTLSLKLNNHTVHFFYNEVRPQRGGGVVYERGERGLGNMDNLPLTVCTSYLCERKEGGKEVVKDGVIEANCNIS